MKLLTTALALSAFLASSAAADLMWDEQIDGDLSDDHLNPTEVFTKGVNNNVLFETTAGDDRDYFTFTIEEGYELSAIILNLFETEPEGNLGFISINAGSTCTDPDAPDVTSLLGYALIGFGNVGNDIMQDMGQGGGAQGFSGPLGAGTYTIWAQETGPSSDLWSLNFVVNQIPAPGALAVLALGGLGMSRKRRH